MDAAAPFARLLIAEADIKMAHDSGRPWLLGRAGVGELRTFTVGPVRVAVIGTCLSSPGELRQRIELAVARDTFDRLAALSGSYHLVVSTAEEMQLFGDVAGFRRVFTCRAGTITIASSHADVLRRLIGAPVSPTWMAARLTSPEMPSSLRDSLSPFHGVRPIPAAHRLIVRHSSSRYAPYWTPPRGTTPLAVGAESLASALTSAVGGRKGSSETQVSVQLSGGLDSTALSCLAAASLRERPKLLLVTTGSVSPANDDLVWARQVAIHLAPAEHVVLSAEESPLFFDGPSNMAPGMDEPAPFTAASARVRHLAQLLAARGVQAHFNGQGGDEVLLAPLAYLSDVLRHHSPLGWRHLRGQAALRDLRLLRLARSAIGGSTYAQWLRWAASNLRIEATPETDATGWEAQPVLPRWASDDAEQLVRRAIFAAPPTAAEQRSTHAALVRIRSTAYRAALYRDALAGHGVPAAFPFLDRAVIEAALAVRPWERTDPWQPKPLLHAALACAIPARLLARRTKAHYNGEIYRGWMANRHKVDELLDDSRLAELGLVDIDMLRQCLGSFGPSGLAPAFVTDTIACEAWLRSLAPPFTHLPETDDVRKRHQDFSGSGCIERAGRRRHDVDR